MRAVSGCRQCGSSPPFWLQFPHPSRHTRSQTVRPSAVSPAGSRVLYIKFRCEPRRITRPHKAQNGRTGTCHRGLKIQEDSLLVHRKMFLPVCICPFEISAEIPGHRLGEGVHHGDDPFFIRGRHHAASLLFADLSWFFFASSHNQNTSQGCKPESF